MYSTVCLCVFLVTLNTPQLVTSAMTKRNVDAGDLPIKYPGPTKQTLQNRYSSGDNSIPEECQGRTYCTIKPDDYPEEKYNEMFKSFKGAPAPPTVVEEVSVVNRQGDPDEKDNCETIVTYDRLYKVRENRESDWRTVVQAPKADYVQRVRLETCLQEEAACFTVFPPTSQYTTFCKQKYNTWEVLVDDGNGGTEKIKAELPVCCSCHYRPTSIISRLAKPTLN